MAITLLLKCTLSNMISDIVLAVKEMYNVGKKWVVYKAGLLSENFELLIATIILCPQISHHRLLP